jgi:hypothetical protein
MLAFHGDPNLKTEYLKSLRDAIFSDQSADVQQNLTDDSSALVRQIYTLEHKLGIPQDLALLTRCLFPGAENQHKFLNSVIPSTRLEHVSSEFCIWCSGQYDKYSSSIEKLFDRVRQDVTKDEYSNYTAIRSALNSLFRNRHTDTDQWNLIRLRLHSIRTDDTTGNDAIGIVGVTTSKVDLLYAATSVGVALSSIKTGRYDRQQMIVYIAAVKHLLELTVIAIAGPPISDPLGSGESIDKTSYAQTLIARELVQITLKSPLIR